MCVCIFEMFFIKLKMSLGFANQKWLYPPRLNGPLQSVRKPTVSILIEGSWRPWWQFFHGKSRKKSNGVSCSRSETYHTYGGEVLYAKMPRKLPMFRHNRVIMLRVSGYFLKKFSLQCPAGICRMNPNASSTRGDSQCTFHCYVKLPKDPLD